MIQTSIQARRTLWFIAASMLAIFAIPASAQAQLFHPTNTVWRYQTDLAVQQAAGTDWVNPGFDDSSWPEGKGLFGNEANYPYRMNTVIPSAAAGPFIAVYYRTHFTWGGGVAGVALAGTNYVDDGSIIYLNGVEIARFNMPATANAGTPDALAPAANPGGYPNANNGEPVLVQLQIDLSNLTNGNSNPLVLGDNVIAVQVHQNTSSSSDRVFGLALYGAQCAPPCFTGTQPTNRTIRVGRSTTFVATESCGIPAPTLQWYRNVGAGEELIQGATAANYTLNNATEADSGLYYVKATSTSMLCGGTAYSPQAMLTVSPDSQAPKLLSGRLGANNLEIIVVADEPVCPDDNCAGNATLTFNWEIYVEGDNSQQLGIAGIVVNGNTLTFTLSEFTPWATDTRYVVRLLPFGGGTIGDLYGNLLSGGDPFSSVTTPAAASAISVGPGNLSDLYTFDSAPTAFEFTTSAMVGGAGDVTTPAALESRIQALDAATITTGLASATGTPPGNAGLTQYASDGKHLITRPTGTLANNINAHIRNDTGSAQSSFRITYTLGVEGPVTEEVPGHLVYYSLSGAPNTWVPIPELSGGTAGTKDSGNIILGRDAWAPGATVYVLWVDDNGSGSPDTAYEIDNFKVRADVIVCDYSPPVLVRAVSRDSTTIVLTFSAPMAASAGTTAPYTVSGAMVTAASLSPSGAEVSLTTTPRSVGNATVTISGITDNRSFCGPNLIYPNPTTVRLTTVQKVVDWNAPWQFNTNPLDNHPDWKTTGAGGWVTGNGLFGMETSAAATNAFPVPIATFISPPTSHGDMLTTYFRKSVTLPALSPGQSYALGYYVDDGAVFYLDGVEIGRFNMPSGPVRYFTVASAELPEGMLHSLPFNASAGDHILAVELHQTSLSNSDTVFGAQLLIVPTESPALNIVHSGTNAVVGWNADSSWMLVGSTNVAGPYTAIGGAAPPSYSRPVTTPAAQFYKLNYVPQP